jgi:integrase
VKQWAEALKHEKDTHSRLLWALIANHGWRPSHVANLKWRNALFDGEGNPVVIVADGVDEGFKTHSPIATRLSPEVSGLLKEWRSECNNVRPEDPLLPWRTQGRQTTEGLHRVRVGYIWQRLEKRWGLPHLRPKDLRHWVAGVCRRVGLSKQASAYLMGHDSASGGAMRDWYDAPQLQDVFLEQEECLPNGALGYLDPPRVEVIGGLPEEAISLLRSYLTGELPTLEFMNKIEALRLSNMVIKP